MDEMEFTEAESNLNDLVAEYQQYQVKQSIFKRKMQKYGEHGKKSFDRNRKYSCLIA